MQEDTPPHWRFHTAKGRVMNRRTLVLTLVAVLVLAGLGVGAWAYLSSGKSSSTSAENAVTSGVPGTAQSAVTAGKGGTVRLGGATLTVPPGAVPSDGAVSATTANPPPVAGTLGDGSGIGLLAASPPVTFTLTGTTFTSSATLTMPVNARVASDPTVSQRPDTFWLASYDPPSGAWQPVPSRYDPAHKTVSAQVSHLSGWAVWTWNWPDLLTRTRQALSGFGSGRAPQAACPSVNGVTITNDGGNDPPIVGCVSQDASSGPLTVAITNNRGFAMVLQGPDDATLQPPTYKGFSEWARNRPGVMQYLGGVYLAPTETVTYTVPALGGPEVFSAAPSWKTHVIDDGIAAADAVFGAVTLGYSNCIFDNIARSEPAPLSDAPGMVVECFPVLAEGNAIYKFYEDHIQPVQDFTKNALTQYDEIRDTLLNVHGQVQITRPALPTPDLSVKTGYELGALYQHPNFPNKIGIDNHDYLSDLTWTIGTDKATATGMLHQLDCVPDCADGTYETFPVRVVASQPQQCTVTVYPQGSDTGQARDAYVFSLFSVQALSGSPQPYLLGDNVIGPGCG